MCLSSSVYLSTYSSNSRDTVSIPLQCMLLLRLRVIASGYTARQFS